MDPTISVIICTHNPNLGYLHRTLESLRAQTLPVSQWELIVVDNSSSVPVKDAVSIDWNAMAKVVVEKELGLTSARIRGIQEARSEILVFVDDDNVLDRNYLQTALKIMSAMPWLGCIGAGNLIPEFEEEPSDSVLPYVGMLALRSTESPIWSNQPADRMFPCGAGLVTTSKIANLFSKGLAIKEFKEFLGRKGDSLSACEDVEFTYISCDEGLGKGVFPELTLTHLIPRSRVQEGYILRIAEGHSFSWSIFDWARLGVAPRINRRPTLKDVCRSCLTMRLSKAISEIFSWNRYRSKLPFEKKVEDAKEKGKIRAIQLINQKSNI